MRLVISHNDIGKWAAHYICRKILQFHPKSDRLFVLGLPTGSTPLAMYKELVRLHERNVLSFKHVVTFNMDEYVGLSADHPQSYHYYMYHNFFKHVDILDKNVHILNGNATNLELECQSFEKKIEQFGGMNLIIGGVGVDGHIAFNEPGSSLTSITRVKTLNHSTVCANSRFFDNDIKATPHLALTMGIKTILSAEEVVILASGVNKSLAVSQAVEGGVSSMCPISAVQLHSKAAIVCDEDATHELKVKTVKYFDQMQDEYSLIDKDTYLQ